MRKSIYLIFLISAFSLSTGSLYAVDLNNGFFDIQWKTNLSQLAGFKKVGENLNVSYYMNPKRVFTIDDIRIPDVVYGSHANQFFAVYVNIDNIEVFAQIRRHLNRNYGVPKITQRMPAEQTTYQWKHEKTKIKLKTYENKNNMKMAFYYTPLSRKVNESQQEAFHENFRRPRFPLDDRRMQRAKDVMEFEGLGPR
ncbi:MAG: hypothetical protein OES70_06565 [Desulfobacterales bacterium]|jgi:hypothetical protein|nr:hypothetical protein [Desulfobacterales bacterium]